MSEQDYLEEITRGAKPLINNQDLGTLVEMLKNKKIVMLGESTHGTKEFYEWRKIISQELISKHGFKFIAVEGDWPPCQKINQYIQAGQAGSELGNAREVLHSFSRWPTWMWANHEMIDFVEWLRAWNSEQKSPVGFHGLDLYSFYESIDEVLLHLRKIDPELANDAAKHYACLGQYRHDEKAYLRSLFKDHEGCKRELTAVLVETLNRTITSKTAKESWFDAKQNALVALNAENYYRAMLFGDEDTWNIRDNHMMETLKMLMEHYKQGAKAIIWAHNTHIGDYRATDMVSNRQVNIGGLAREIYGKESVALVGFGTSSGSVLASQAWDGPMNSINISAPVAGTLDYYFHEAVGRVGSPDYYLIFNSHGGREHIAALSEIRGQRAIGVVYDPLHEKHGGVYVPTSLPNRYDAFVYCDHTNALTPLEVTFEREKIPETYPHGARI